MIRILNRLLIDKNKYFLNQALYSAFTFSVLYFSARLLSLAEFGEFSYIVSFFPLLNIIPTTLIYFPMMNYYSHYKEDEGYFSINFKFNIILTALLASVLVIILLKVDVEFIVGLALVLYYLMFQSYEFFRREVITKKEVGKGNILDIIKLSLLTLGMGVIYFFAEASVFIYTAAVSFALFCSIVVATKFSEVKIKIRKGREKAKIIIQQAYNFGKWLLLANVIQNLGSNLFVYISVLFLTTEEIAMLNAPKIFLGVSTIFLLSMDNYLTPRIVERRRVRKVSMKNELWQIFDEMKLFYMSLITLGAIMIVFQDEIMLTVFGREYIAVENYLWGFISTGIIFSFIRPFLIVFRVLNLTKVIFHNSLWVLTVSAIIVYPLMSNFGIFGGVLSMIIPSVIQLLIHVYYLNKYNKLICE